MGEVREFKKKEKSAGLPSDLDAEHALLGILLYDNHQLHAVSDRIFSDAFFEPTHGRVFDAISSLIGSGGRADPLTVNHAMFGDEGLASLNGVHFLMNLVDMAPSVSGVTAYADLIRELWKRRELIRMAEALIAQASGGESAEKLVEAAERDLVALQLATATSRVIGTNEAIDNVTAQLEQAERAFGVQLGLPPLDELNGGLMRGEMWLLAGRPGAGKSAIASSAVMHVARHTQTPAGEPMGVIEICCEMTVEQMTRRHIADLAFEMYGTLAPSYSAMRKRTLTPDQKNMFYAAAKRLREIPTLKMVYRAGLSIAGLRSMVRRQASAWSRQGVRLGLISVDHVGLLRPSHSLRGSNRTQEQGEIAREMKDLAGELDIPILALVQLSRRVEERDNRRPILSDLRDSGEWEQSADGVIGVYRDAYYAQRELEPRRQGDRALWEERKASKEVEAIVLKIREGEAQTVKLWADMARNAIRGSAPEAFYGHQQSSGASLNGAWNPDEQWIQRPPAERFD